MSSQQILFLGVEHERHSSYEDLVEACADRHQVVYFNPHKDVDEQFAGIDIVADHGGTAGHRKLYEAGKRHGVKHWQIIGSGLDHIDLESLLSMGFTVSNLPSKDHAIPLAEHVIFMMLFLYRNYDETRRCLETGQVFLPTNEELFDKTLGLVGFGATGREVAKRAHAFGMKILAIDARTINKSTQHEFHLEYFGSPNEIDRILKASDCISIHVPLTSATRHMISRNSFALMKPSSIFINVSRAEIVEEDALIEALQTGKIAGAGVDVFPRDSKEPPSPDHPLIKMKNVVSTPHISGKTMGASRRRARAAARNCDRIANGLPPLNQIMAP